MKTNFYYATMIQKIKEHFELKRRLKNIHRTLITNLGTFNYGIIIFGQFN